MINIKGTICKNHLRLQQLMDAHLESASAWYRTDKTPTHQDSFGSWSSCALPPLHQEQDSCTRQNPTQGPHHVSLSCVNDAQTHIQKLVCTFTNCMQLSVTNMTK